MITAYSAVTVENIPTDAKVVFAYANPPFAQIEAVEAHCPHARIEPIVTHTDYMGELYDFESGAIAPDQAGETVAYAIQKGIRHPACYFSLSNHDTVVASLKAAHITRHQVRLVVAHYTIYPDLPDWADGVQWTAVADGKSLNQYELRDDFFHWRPLLQPPARQRF